VAVPLQSSLHPVPLLASDLKSLALLARGKVRDNYAVGDDRLLMVASDRLSAFDVVMGEPIPGKGELLTRMALFWFARLGHVVPNHLTGADPESVVAADERTQIRGRAMLVKRLRPLPVEAVVRGYLAGSGWKEYQANGQVCGVRLPSGLKNASRLPEPIFTPATKAAMGEHDENIPFERMEQIVGSELAHRVREVSIRLYREAAAFALGKGIIIADTKFEFGLDGQGTLTLMDEILTPDSSRYWPLESYELGGNPPSFDKQFVRDWLEGVRIDGRPWNKRAPAPALPAEVIEKTAAKYREALARLTAT
jgi:phosphoribosylaminoimidazole-succinocarboxamide synthase